MRRGDINPGSRPGGYLFKRALWLLLALGTLVSSQAALQFDVFLGFDAGGGGNGGIVPEASWFPVVCEIKNDGPGFKATIELQGGTYNQGQLRRLEVELPTGTLKRVVIPMFASARGYTSWDARLLDERGKTRSEVLGIRPRRQLARGTPLMGALSRSAGGTPVMKTVMSQSPELQPAAARLLPTLLPDNPLVLEGMESLYLNSERATDLTLPQVNSLLAWLHGGGHLIIAVEQPSDITSSPWLKNLFPCDVKDLHPLAHHPELQDWLRGSTWKTNAVSSSNPLSPAEAQMRLRYGIAGSAPSTRSIPQVNNPFASLEDDTVFEVAEMQVATGRLREGEVELASGDTPLIVTASRGRGRVTALLFSPEREPVRSWKNLPVFWAKLADVPGSMYSSREFAPQGGWSSDGIFGAMIDSRQVHKLPVGWLLLLLLVYLVVIGPLDQYWLKRIGKPMLTWITFPTYVVLFSLVIYFIGYKLRAGESEWNELHVVDILPKGDAAELRGRTYSSVYSPANQRYQLEAQETYATFRGEFMGLWGGGQSAEKAVVSQTGDNFKAEVFVPVWTSELFVSDWLQSASTPLSLTVTPQGDGWQVQLQNRTERKLANLQLVVGAQMYSLGDLAMEESRTISVNRSQGRSLKSYLVGFGSRFQGAVNSRHQALGRSESGQISDLPESCVAASFLSQLAAQNYGFVAPPGLDLSPLVEQGEAVVLAWAADYSPVKPLYQFKPRRSQHNTLWRLAVPIKANKGGLSVAPEA
jgi:hypothetical protein